MGTEEPKYVTFEDSEGNEISNDPRWKARKVLDAAGETAETVDVTAYEAKIAELEAQLAAARTVQHGVDEDEDLGSDDEDADKPRDYKELTGKALGSYAKERGIALKDEDGKALSAGDVRAALIAQDNEN